CLEATTRCFSTSGSSPPPLPTLKGVYPVAMPSDMDTSIGSRNQFPMRISCSSSTPDSKILEKFLESHTTPASACNSVSTWHNIIDNIDTYDFQTETAKNQFCFHAYQFQEEARTRYISLKEDEFNAEKEMP
ncbi:hypothetical protein TNCV_784021, partial [Trichonephila clavipes]